MRIRLRLKEGARSTIPVADGHRGAERLDASAERAIKSPPMSIDGRVMSAGDFVSYIEGLAMPSPLPTRVFLHHTWKPTRESWQGLSTINGMKRYYEKQLWRDMNGKLREGWTAGPHLFVADDGIWLFSDIRYDGVGALGHNTGTRHLEMVGNYDGERPSGATLENTIAALGILHVRLGLDIANLSFHRDVSTKSCPGWAVTKDWIIPLVARWIEEYRRSKQPVTAPDTRYQELKDALTAMIKRQLVPGNKETPMALDAERRRLLGPLTYQLPMEIDGQDYLVQIYAEGLMIRADKSGQVLSLAEMEAYFNGAPVHDVAVRDDAEG
ncbi:MAG: peptidoglycan recognition protein family protein [Anaerolineae bacterium]